MNYFRSRFLNRDSKANIGSLYDSDRALRDYRQRRRRRTSKILDEDENDSTRENVARATIHCCHPIIEDTVVPTETETPKKTNSFRRKRNFVRAIEEQQIDPSFDIKTPNEVTSVVPNDVVQHKDSNPQCDDTNIFRRKRLLSRRRSSSESSAVSLCVTTKIVENSPAVTVETNGAKVEKSNSFRRKRNESGEENPFSKRNFDVVASENQYLSTSLSSEVGSIIVTLEQEQTVEKNLENVSASLADENNIPANLAISFSAPITETASPLSSSSSAIKNIVEPKIDTITTTIPTEISSAAADVDAPKLQVVETNHAVTVETNSYVEKISNSIGRRRNESSTTTSTTTDTFNVESVFVEVKEHKAEEDLLDLQTESKLETADIKRDEFSHQVTPTVQLFNSHTTNIAQRILDDESTNFPNLDDSISEVENQNDVDNDQVQQQEIVKGEEEDEEDPLSFIQIKSAAQWKAVSKRISWNFDDASETTTMATVNAASIEEKEKNYCGVVKERTISPSVPIKTDLTEIPCQIHDYENINFDIYCREDDDTIPNFKPTKVQQLRLACWKIKPWKQPKSLGGPKLFSSIFASAWGADCDEVHPRLFIGDKGSATNVAFLKKYGITHVLNTAEGSEEGLVDLNSDHYEGTGITYLGFPLWDAPGCNIIPYLGIAADYICSAIDQSGGKCLVNCQMGVSRSASCAISYMMIHLGMTAVEALTQIRKSRDCRPNDGFLIQLANLDNCLRKERELGLPKQIRLSTLTDRFRLPLSWHNEFWIPGEVTEDDLGFPLLPMGQSQSFKILIDNQSKIVSPTSLSRRTSIRSSRTSSKRNSFRAGFCSNNKSSRRSSVKRSRPTSICLSTKSDEAGGDWEWVWETDDEVDDAIEEEESNNEENLLKGVNDIITEPEENWRHILERIPSPSKSSSNNNNNGFLTAQIGVEEDDPLAIVKVASAKQWKSISRKLTINFDDLEEVENAESKHQQITVEVEQHQDKINHELSALPPVEDDEDTTKSKISIANFNEVLEQARKISQQTTLEISQLRTSRQPSSEPPPSDQKKSRPTSKWLNYEPTPRPAEEELVSSQTTATPQCESKPIKSQEILSEATTKYSKNEPKTIITQEEILSSQTTSKYLNEPTSKSLSQEVVSSQTTAQYLTEHKHHDNRSQTVPIPINQSIKTLPSSSQFTTNNKAPFYEFLEEAMKSSEKINSTPSIPQPGLEVTDAEGKNQNLVVQSRPQTPDSFSPTKVEDLRKICWQIKPWDQPPRTTFAERQLFTSMLGTPWGVDADEVHPRILVGDQKAAKNIRFLKRYGITHVLNAAEGPWEEHCVNLSEDHYVGSGITYLGLPLWDSTDVKIQQYLGCAAEFIKSAMDTGQKILVNCQMGVSRSCSAAMAYLMIYEGMSALDILKTFRRRRDVRPNDYFMEQLVELDNDLRKEREMGIPKSISLPGLNELHNLPKPWHFEFWNGYPDEDLPFQMTYLKPVTKSTKTKSASKPGSNRTSRPTSIFSNGSWEWEYYSDGDDNDNDLYFEE